MIITELKPYDDGKGFLKLFADGKYVLSITEQTAEKFSLKQGEEITASQISALKTQSLVHRARERLLYCLDRREHSEKELRDKLFGKYPQDVIQSAISEIKDLGLIDDRKFALAFARHRKQAQKKGPYAVRQELFSKGVCREYIDEAINSVFSDEQEQLNTALRVCEKYKGEINTPNGKRKAFAALVQKGFDYSVVKKAVNLLCQDEFCE